jgi:hypothetical protein
MTKLRDRLPSIALAVAATVLSAAGGHTEGLVSVPETQPGFLKGYLAREMLPDSAALLPPRRRSAPPASRSIWRWRAPPCRCVILRAGRSRQWTPT